MLKNLATTKITRTTVQILQDFQRLLKIIHDLSHDLLKIADDFEVADNRILSYIVSPSVTRAVVNPHVRQQLTTNRHTVTGTQDMPRDL